MLRDAIEASISSSESHTALEKIVEKSNSRGRLERRDSQFHNDVWSEKEKMGPIEQTEKQMQKDAGLDSKEN